MIINLSLCTNYTIENSLQLNKPIHLFLMTNNVITKSTMPVSFVQHPDGSEIAVELLKND